MKLGELVRSLEIPSALSQDDLGREVLDIAQDSRKVKPGSLFVAVRGFNSDGHLFVLEAIKKGAIAVVTEQATTTPNATNTPQLVVENSRRALALLANAFYDHPSRRLKLIGITGTNGKTTTAYLMKSIIEATGSVAGLIGTIEYRIGERVYPAPNTTPESVDIQRLLAEMTDLGAKYCTMEVSSHALELGRTLGCSFAAAAFTNITQDHLDFHETMDAYFRAKLLLFSGLAADRYAVINLDDARAAEVIGATKAKVLTTGMTDRADVHPQGSVRHGIEGLTFEAATPQGPVAVVSPLVGRHNVYNILTAIGLGTALGLNVETISIGIRNMKAVPGRMEKIDEGQPYGVLVDYAHTEDALVRLLDAVREITASRIITVFGCGGDRDRTKRPKMGAAAIKGSDIVIVTSDNPRTEDPLNIIKEIESGMEGGIKMHPGDSVSAASSGKTPHYSIPDRRAAVEMAIGLARSGDTVVLAGKGHEGYQIVGSDKISYDDRQVARIEISKKQKVMQNT